MARTRTTPDGPEGADDGRGAPPPSPAEEPSSQGDVEAAVQRVFAPHLLRAEGQRLWAAWRGTLRLLRPLGAVSLGNRVAVLSDGDEVFERMWAAIEAAERSVRVNTYTLDPDRVGLRTLSLLTDAARRGLDVSLVYDAFGSVRLAAEHTAALRAAGARVLVYNPIARWPWRASRLIRNHRKILVVDDERAFCGGMNVSGEYAGKRLGNDRFRDTHLELVGPCAADLGELCESLFSEVEGTLPATPLVRRGEAARDGSLVQILESHIGRHRRAIQRSLRCTIRRCQARCYLTTPYFVPPLRLTRSLVRAARRGVDVRILTAGDSDVPLVHWASQHLYGRLLREGVRIFEYTSQNLHAKTAAIDGVYASVGSFNLDRWSYRRNLEVTVGVLDDTTAARVEEHFERDLASSREVKLDRWRRRTWWQRLLHWAAYQVARI